MYEQQGGLIAESSPVNKVGITGSVVTEADHKRPRFHQNVRYWVEKLAHKIRRDKLYLCPICKKSGNLRSYTRRYSLKRHIRNHHFMYKKTQAKLRTVSKSTNIQKRTSAKDYDVEFIDAEKNIDKKDTTSKIIISDIIGSSVSSNVQLESESDHETSMDLCTEEVIVTDMPIIENETTYTDIQMEDDDHASSDTTGIGMSTDTDTSSIEQYVKELCVRDPSKKRTSYIWNFVEVIKENHIYKCKFCDKKIAISPFRTSNISRHISNKHKLEYSLMQKYMAENNKEDAKTNKEATEHRKEAKAFQDCYFEVLDGESVRCKICSEVMHGNAEEENPSLFAHINEKHSDEIVSYVEKPTASNIVDNEIHLIVVQEPEQ